MFLDLGDYLHLLDDLIIMETATILRDSRHLHARTMVEIDIDNNVVNSLVKRELKADLAIARLMEKARAIPVTHIHAICLNVSDYILKPSKLLLVGLSLRDENKIETDIILRRQTPVPKPSKVKQSGQVVKLTPVPKPGEVRVAKPVTGEAIRRISDRYKTPIMFHP